MKWFTKKTQVSYEARKAQAIAALIEAEQQLQAERQAELVKLEQRKQALILEARSHLKKK